MLKQLPFLSSLCSLFCILFLTDAVFCQQQADLNKTIFLDASIDADNNTITLDWELFPETTSHLIFRKSPSSSSWGSEIANLDGNTSSYTFDQVVPGEEYDFRVFRLSTNGSADGYLRCGIEVVHAPFGKHLIMVVSSTLWMTLESEIIQYQSVVEREGWFVSTLVVDEDAGVETVKELIIQEQASMPAIKTSVFLFGHIPVPYSGNIGPDGHSNHIGAWPADGYYGDIDGIWTDVSVNNTSGGQNRTHNIPGDGKFDQSSFPSTVELAVGRVDFSGLPLFEDDEITLSRKYLMKNIAFRKNQMDVQRRGIVENNFGHAEGFGQNGYKNFAALLGKEQVAPGDYSMLYEESYLWSYGAGGGNYTGASGIGNTAAFASDSLQTIFTMLFGSYFGDWDSNNNFLRAALASGTTLSNAWAGRPNWYFHPMGMGADLGDCTLLSMNNGGTYTTGFSGRQVHMALIGDPSLKMDYFNPPEAFEVEEMDGHALLNWKSDDDNSVNRFNIYKSRGEEQPELIARVDGSMSSYVDSCLNQHELYDYYITASKLHLGASGSYFLESAYLHDTISIQTDVSVTAGFVIGNQIDLTIELLNTTIGEVDSLVWDFGDGMFSTEESPTHMYDVADIYTVTLTVYGLCGNSTFSQEINVETSSTEEITQFISVYPNPTTNFVHIHLESKNLPKILEITDIQQQLVYKMEIRHPDHVLDVSKFVSGVYVMRFSGSANKVYSFVKLDVQR